LLAVQICAFCYSVAVSLESLVSALIYFGAACELPWAWAVKRLELVGTRAFPISW
jgi:hypothetical protein